MASYSNPLSRCDVLWCLAQRWVPIWVVHRSPKQPSEKIFHSTKGTWWGESGPLGTLNLLVPSEERGLVSPFSWPMVQPVPMLNALRLNRPLPPLSDGVRGLRTASQCCSAGVSRVGAGELPTRTAQNTSLANPPRHGQSLLHVPSRPLLLQGASSVTAGGDRGSPPNPSQSRESPSITEDTSVRPLCPAPPRDICHSLLLQCTIAVASGELRGVSSDQQIPHAYPCG